MQESTRDTIKHLISISISQKSLARNLFRLASEDEAVKVDLERVVEQIHHRDPTDEEIKNALQAIIDRPTPSESLKRPDQEAWDALWEAEEEAKLSEDNPWEQ